jgi:hypothetical protein
LTKNPHVKNSAPLTQVLMILETLFNVEFFKILVLIFFSSDGINSFVLLIVIVVNKSMMDDTDTTPRKK